MNAATENTGHPNRRSNYLTNPGFQWRCAGTIALVIFIVSTFVSFVQFGVLHQQARMRLMDPENSTGNVGLVLICFALGSAALTSAGVGLWSILMTHRICGPLVVIKRYLRELAAGRLPVMRPLRQNDELKDLYEALEETVNAVRARTQQERSQLRAALEDASRARNAQDETVRAAVHSAIHRLEALQSRLDETLVEAQAPAQPRGLPAVPAGSSLVPS